MLDALASARDPAAVARRMALAARYTWEANARATIAAWGRVLGQGATR